MMKHRASVLILALATSYSIAQRPHDFPTKMYCGGNQSVTYEEKLVASDLAIQIGDIGSSPMPNATVQLENQSKHILVLDKKADGDGKFRVRGIPPGKYWLGFSAPGYNLHYWTLTVPKSSKKAQLLVQLTVGT
jgi:Carboxypeptidase regulatory-like domain